MSRQLIRNILLCGVGLALSAAATAPAEEDFPLRAKYPMVRYMTTEALHRGYQSIIIIDVRSKIEHSVIRINNSINLPVSTALFIRDLARIRDKDGPTPIAFYCNGHTCAKSYEAAEKAMEGGFKNVYAYDAGIYDWVKAHPDKGTLMDKTPVPMNKLISRERLLERKIAYEEFARRAQDPAAMVIDIREPFQRETVPQFPALRNIPSDRFADLIRAGEFKGKRLLILDAVGKQVEWIQYYLEMYGYADYFFLDKGVAGVK